ncbi:ubiquitin carboxyl-terminal hydrolase creB [Phlyctema vagabunda]|uniref:Ubiquitin carboxyl-terminal hydrolase n=1 Tax=Phlyctema vagabunda TaxID=108571 RepID=A0ABR4P7H0_9HELO
MSGLFSKFGKGSGQSQDKDKALPARGKNKNVEEPEPEITPLVKMLQNAGPVRPDGSDKFFGMENFGNTCYCNSVIQALYYSRPFREHVVQYPPHSPHDTPNGQPSVNNPPIRVVNGGAVSPVTKGISAKEAMARRKAIANNQPVAPLQGQRPEDKPDSPEYKKKHAMLAGPVLDLTFENAASYGMEESTFTALKDIFMALIANQSRTGVLSPARFLEIFKRDNEMFRTSMHQDAHEFYGLVLNAVITNVEANAQRMKEIELPRNNDALAQSMRTSLTSAANAMGLTNGTRSPGTGWVHDIFEGVLTSETKCLTCETASQRDETFLDLSIDLDQHSSVTSCLRKFSAEEMLCERNKFHCDNCGGLQEAEKRMKIKQLPKILALHLKRFKYTEDMTRLQKLFHRVVYPYHLRMFNTTDDAEDPDRLYELYAVVVHIGGNAYHGHYVSVIKTEDRGWLLFDDEMVEPVDKHYVRNFFGDKPGQACAYVLFYQETTEEKMRKEQEAEGLAEVALASAEAEVAQGHPQPNGTHPSSVSKRVSIPGTPVEEREFASLAHAATAPLPMSPGFGKDNYSVQPPTPLTAVTTKIKEPPLTKAETKPSKATIKEEKEREKAAKKEAEKQRKLEEKDKAKKDEARRKELEVKRRETQKQQADEYQKAMALSKQTAAEDEERRKREASATAANLASTSTTSTSGGSVFTGTENGNGNGSTAQSLPKEQNGFGSLKGLSRTHRNSKSMSKRSMGSFGFSRSKTAGPDLNGETLIEGEPGPQTPEKHEQKLRDRFSFGALARKKSTNLMSP